MHLASYMYEPIVEDFITLNLSIYIIHNNNLTLTGVRKEHLGGRVGQKQSLMYTWFSYLDNAAVIQSGVAICNFDLDNKKLIDGLLLL